MFYKDEYLTREERESFIHTPEFCYAIYEKMKILPSIILLDIHCHDHEGNIVKSFPVPALKNSKNDQYEHNQDKIKSYITIKGNYTFYTSSSFSEKHLIEGLNKQFKKELNKQLKDDSDLKISKLSYNEISYSDLIEKYKLDSEKLQQSRQLLDNFFNLVEEGILYDKNKQPYYYQLVQNSDMNIGENLIIDELLLYKIKEDISDLFIGKKVTPSKLKMLNKDNIESVGYLKAKYTTSDIVELLDKKLNDNFPVVKTPVSIKNKNKPKEISPFLNLATIDYSHIDEPFKNKGLGYAMYFHMAKYLNLKNIEFRQSSLNSEYATRLWQGIQKHWKDNITLKPFMNTNLCFLSIGSESILQFKNSKPIIKTKKLKN